MNSVIFKKGLSDTQRKRLRCASETTTLGTLVILAHFSHSGGSAAKFFDGGLQLRMRFGEFF